MVGKTEKIKQMSISETPIIQFIDIEHPLCVLARRIDWESVEKDFSDYYINFGRPRSDKKNGRTNVIEVFEKP